MTLLMTPGPTEVPGEVRRAMARPVQNPDVDPDFAPYYRELTAKLRGVYGTDDDVLILGGEGILGLEAAVASLVEPGDPVLCIANGLYGEYFADFVRLYGGDPVVCRTPHTEPIDPEAVGEHLRAREFVAATMVHCETPTGVLNDLDPVLEPLDQHGVLSIVDAVSSLGGTPVPTDLMDVCVCGSQKCLSSPPGLTTLSVSDRAWDRVAAVDARAYYTSLRPWKEQWLDEEWFPYTHLVSNLYALEASIDRLQDEGPETAYRRHREVAAYCRERGERIGLETYPGDDALCSPTVTAFHVEGVAGEIQKRVHAEYDVLLATGLGEHEDDVLRVGHMGYNADREKVARTMDAIEAVWAHR